MLETVDRIEHELALADKGLRKSQLHPADPIPAALATVELGLDAAAGVGSLATATATATAAQVVAPSIPVRLVNLRRGSADASAG